MFKTDAFMTTIVGLIEHRLRLSQDSSEFVKNKRKRKLDEVEACVRDAGIFFVPSETLGGKEYLLIIPQALFKTVCDAVRLNKLVKISHFTIINLPVEHKALKPGPELALMELGTIEILTHMNDPRPCTSAVTLTELRDLQVSLRSTALNLVGIVDSISPVIAVVPSDPFCLVEMYQLSEYSEDALSCVLVIKGESALSCHGGIMPGDKIMVENIPCQRWNVPKALRTKGFGHIQVPNRVMVVTDAKSIVWQEKQDVDYIVPISMAMVQGYVHTTEATAGIVHRVELVDGKAKYYLFTDAFPMSTNLQYGLRKGARVSAINVHLLLAAGTTNYYAACLRSTIAIIGTASSNDTLTKAPRRKEVATSALISKRFIPWRYARIRFDGFRRALSEYLRRNSKLSVELGFSNEELVETILKLYSRHDGGLSPLSTLAGRCVRVTAKSKRRDQFSEFFDHGREGIHNESEQYGCHMSFPEEKCLVRPIVLRISCLKKTLLEIMKVRLVEWLEQLGDAKVQGGSVTSIQLPNHDVSQAITGDADTLLCVTGRISALPTSYDGLCLGDSISSCPITSLEPFSIPECFSFQNVVCHPKVCIVSALCLGVSPSDKTSSWYGLEPWTKSDQAANEGSCTLAELNGYVFIVSIHVHCQTIISTQIQPICIPAITSCQKSHTVEQMLDPQHVICSEGFFTGILCRHRLNFTKIKAGQFQGMSLTIAHSTLARQGVDTSAFSMIQSLELNVSTELPREKIAEFIKSSQCLPSVLSGSLLEEQYGLAVAWWKMADGPLSALVACGIDEAILSEKECNDSTVRRFVPVIVVPTSSMSLETHGFRRFKCNHTDVKVRLVEMSNLELESSQSSNANLTSLGNQRHPRGVLNRHFPMMRSSMEEFPTRQQHGIQEVALGDLHQCICADMRMSSQSSLAPSLVRLVRGARFLAVSYCKVQAVCSRCHSSLIRIQGEFSQLSGILGNDPRRNFWASTTANEQSFKRSRLKCPNHCPNDEAEIIWECSGLLDDGTGQCFLYSERETAMSLLAIDPDTVSAIEAGAWETESGICFQKTLPPSSFLKLAIRDAKVKMGTRVNGRKITFDDVLCMLTPKARALYLLRQFCSKSRKAHQELDFLIRCKPISMNAFQLNRTEVKTADLQLMAMDAVVYSLPPLRVILVSISNIHNTTCAMKI